MIIDTTVSLAMLRAARTHVASNDVRYYLLGVHINFQRGKIEATDGHRAFIGDGPRVRDAANIIISNESIDALLKQAKGQFAQGKWLGAADVGIRVETVDGQVRCTLTLADVTIAAKLVDGTFPDVARIIPEILSGEPAHYDPIYVMDAVQAIAIARNEPPRKAGDKRDFALLAMNGLSPGVVHDGQPGAMVLVMPRRVPEVPPAPLDWARGE